MNGWIQYVFSHEYSFFLQMLIIYLSDDPIDLACLAMSHEQIRKNMNHEMRKMKHLMVSSTGAIEIGLPKSFPILDPNRLSICHLSKHLDIASSSRQGQDLRSLTRNLRIRTNVLLSYLNQNAREKNGVPRIYIWGFITQQTYMWEAVYPSYYVAATNLKITNETLGSVLRLLPIYPDQMAMFRKFDSHLVFYLGRWFSFVNAETFLNDVETIQKKKAVNKMAILTDFFKNSCECANGYAADWGANLDKFGKRKYYWGGSPCHKNMFGAVESRDDSNFFFRTRMDMWTEELESPDLKRELEEFSYSNIKFRVQRPPYQFSIEKISPKSLNRGNDGTFLSRNNGYVLALLRTYLRLMEPQIQYGLSVPSLKDAPANYHHSFCYECSHSIMLEISSVKKLSLRRFKSQSNLTLMKTLEPVALETLPNMVSRTTNSHSFDDFVPSNKYFRRK